MAKVRVQILSWIIAFAILAILYGMWTQHWLHNFIKPEPLTLMTGTLLPQPLPIQSFHLTDINNKSFTNNNFKNQWSMVFFGFTNCPQLCPTTLSVLNQAYKKLQQDQVVLPQVVFVSVDPERDSATKIKDYLASFNPAFIGVSGNEENIRILMQQFNIAYAKILQGDSAQSYRIDHSGTILLVDPAGKLQAIFSTPHNANNIASDYEKIVTATKG